MKKNTLSVFAKYMMMFLMAADIVIMLLLPVKLPGWMLEFFNTELTGGIKTYYYTVLYLGGLVGLYILNNMRRLFTLMQTGSPFVHDTEKLLKCNAYACLFMAVLTASKIFVANTFMTLIMVLIFFTSALFCRVLAELFAKATAYKEENDLTV